MAQRMKLVDDIKALGKAVRGVKPLKPSEELKRLRKALRLTQKRFGEVVGVGKSAVAAWEQGRYEPSKETYIRIGNLDPTQALSFWSRGGIDMGAIMEYAGHALREAGAPPTAHQILACPSLEESGRYISVEGAAGVAGSDVSEILNIIKTNKIRARRVGGTYLVNSLSFMRWLETVLNSEATIAQSKAEQRKSKKK